MLYTHLHPLGRDSPDAAMEIHLAPAGVQGFAGPSRAEDRQFESAGSRRDPLSQGFKKFRHVFIGNR